MRPVPPPAPQAVPTAHHFRCLNVLYTEMRKKAEKHTPATVEVIWRSMLQATSPPLPYIPRATVDTAWREMALGQARRTTLEVHPHPASKETVIVTLSYDGGVVGSHPVDLETHLRNVLRAYSAQFPSGDAMIDGARAICLSVARERG